MKMAQILKRWQSFTKLFILAVMICWAFQACSDDVDKDKDIFGFEGGSKDKILSIEVMNTQNESLRFKTNESQSIFQTDTQRPTLLFFLSKSCQECQDELLHILDVYNKYQEFISIIAISPRDELEHLQKEIDLINPRFKLYAPTDNKNLLNFLNKDEKQSYIALYDRQGEKVIDYVGLVPEEIVELDIQYHIQDQLDAKAQYEMQSLTPEEQEELENANTGQEAQ
ncbi:redoxin domain-containing protein [uncultured Helicobacter sp.]|uniref:TlpA family protein disulfide reductase n=1 Tax=uncultured Helicobacter sp. TaxID=175537 RepID=UPI00260FDB0A|nr:redoxin domain-containing protein [uncultured Helicobacter sp.]